jgi:hypothetical protein
MASLRELVLGYVPNGESELCLQQLLSSAVQGCLLKVVLPHTFPCLDRVKAAHAMLVTERGSRNVPVLSVPPSRWQ